MKLLQGLSLMLLAALVGCNIPAIGSGYETVTAKAEVNKPTEVEPAQTVFDGYVGYALRIDGID